jgi:hypothetical protein
MTGIFSAIAAFPGIGAAATEAEFRLEKPRVFELKWPSRQSVPLRIGRAFGAVDAPPAIL